MSPDQFCYWLQGFSELHPGQPTPEQWQSIREHLGTVFNKVTPPLDAPKWPHMPPIVPAAPPAGMPDWADLRPRCSLCDIVDPNARVYC